MTDFPLMTKDDYETLMSKLSSIEASMKIIVANTKLPTTVNVADVAQIEGISVTNLKAKKPWLMPNCGVSEYEGSRRWKYDTFLKWRELPESTRKEMWIQHTRNTL